MNGDSFFDFTVFYEVYRLWKRGKIVDKIYISRQRLLDSGGVYLSDYLKTTLQNSESDLILKDGILYKFIQTKLAQKMKTIHLIV